LAATDESELDGEAPVTAVSARFEELDWQATPLGEISLRRRHDLIADVEVYEVKLNDEFLMSSLFTAAETALATLALAELERGDLQVLVGGLGLGYTAYAALQDPRTSSVMVIETAAPVIDWHRRELFPDTIGLATDPRCTLVEGDFFARLRSGTSATTYDAILLDIDHTPHHLLSPSHADFYTADGLRSLAPLLVDDGVFGLWSDDPPDPEFEAHLGQVFATTTAHVITFSNPVTRGESASTVYLASHPVRAA
jgi:spermidine synthase